MKRYNAELREQPDNLFLLRELYFMFLSEEKAADLGKLSEWITSVPRTPELSDLAAHVEAGKLALQGRPQKLRSLVDFRSCVV